MVILILLLMVTGFQLVYWWYYYHFSFSKYTPSTSHLSGLPSVSMVVCFKGLPEDFQENLHAMANQDYGDFEIILVNDFSPEPEIKDIKHYLNSLGKSNIRLVYATIDKPGKKHALKEGVAACKNDILLFTDMDCRPDSPLWIQKMSEQLMANNADVVLGYGPMETLNGWVARFSGFETVLTAMQYFGHYFAGIPYMSVGRNWMVKKSVYEQYWHKAAGQDLASGDDDLIFQAMIPYVKTTACLDRDAFVFSKPETSLSAYLHQKSRHISTSVKYPIQTGIILFLFGVSFPLFYILLLISLFFGLVNVWYLIFLCLFKWALQSIFHYRIMKSLNNTFPFYAYLFFEMTLALFYPVLAVYGLFYQKKW